MGAPVPFLFLLVVYFIKVVMDIYIEKALAIAREIPYIQGKSRHVALVINKRGIIVSSAINDYGKTHPLFNKCISKTQQYGIKSKYTGAKKTIGYQHAEFTALLRDRYKKGVRLVVVRIDAQGNPVNSMPCVGCMEYIRLHGNIKTISWT